MAKVVVAYLRVSTNEQSLGLDAQRAAIESFARKNRHEIVAWHCDEGISGGADIASRPGLQSAIRTVKSIKGSMLIVAKRDRVARDVLVSAMVESQVGAVLSADNVGNGSDPSSQFMRSIIDATAQFERSLIRSRTKSALAIKKARNERTGTVPWGFQLASDGKSLVVNAREQVIKERALELKIKGLSLRKIASALAHEGYTTRTSKPFSAQGLQRMLT